jgi:hypothetical protein
MQVNAVDVFIAGVIQGSEHGAEIVGQGYRGRIKAVIEACCPGSVVYDPVAHHPGSVAYSLERARATFYGHVELVAASKLLVAYLPEASMGTSIEMWEARRCDIPVVTISPMRENWVVKLLSTVLCRDLAAFEAWTRAGSLDALLMRGARAAPGTAPP